MFAMNAALRSSKRVGRSGASNIAATSVMSGALSFTAPFLKGRTTGAGSGATGVATGTVFSAVFGARAMRGSVRGLFAFLLFVVFVRSVFIVRLPSRFLA
jgi:hypothetical protein